MQDGCSSRAARDPVFGCDLVLTGLDRDGYAYHGKSRAHIVAWIERNGPVPPGKELDHMCRRRNCRAAHHIEAVTPSENGKRKDWSYRVKRARCPRGHALRTNRQVTPERGIVCRMCNREEGAIE
jgi:hypothetical protein